MKFGAIRPSGSITLSSRRLCRCTTLSKITESPRIRVPVLVVWPRQRVSHSDLVTYRTCGTRRPSMVSQRNPALSPYPQADQPAPASAARRRGSQEGPDGRIGHAGSAQRRYAHDPLTHLRVVVGDSEGQAVAVAAVQRVS